jgi:hypothetical protein
LKSAWKFKCWYAFTWHLGVRFHVFPSCKKRWGKFGVLCNERVPFLGKILVLCNEWVPYLTILIRLDYRLNTCQIQAEGHF